MELDPFRIRAHVADFDAIVEEIVASSARVRETLHFEANVSYGEGPDETLDIFFPDGALKRRPVHIFIHGGYWRMFSKEDYSYIADTVTRAGAIAVVLDYSLMPRVRMSVLIDQVRRAKQWVVSNIGHYGGDPSRITVSGHSAGAHLATFLFQKETTPSEIRAALLLGGLYALKPLQTSFLAPEIGITDEEVADFSPLAHSYDSRCEVFVAVGSDETVPFHEQASEFATCLIRQGLAVSSFRIEGANHMSSVRDLGRPETESGRLLSDIIVGTAGVRT